jgi:adenosylhomocysteine nucleosidase
MAAETAARLLEAAERQGEPARRVLVVGVAGGVDPTLPVGAVLAPAVVVDQATGERYLPDHPPGVESAVGQPSGLLMTTPGLTTGAVALAGLRSAGVTAVDMETAAVARTCQDRGVPWSVLRAVSDRLVDGLVDREVLALTRPDGSTDPLAVASLLLRRPWKVPRLARLGRDAGRAVRAVDRAAIGVLAANR